MKISTYFASTLLVMGLVGGGDAFASSTGSLTFDEPGFELGLIVDDEYASKGVTVSATGGIGNAVVFDTSNQGLGNDDDLLAPFSRVGITAGTSTGGSQTINFWDGGGPDALDPGNILIVESNKNINPPGPQGSTPIVCNSTHCGINTLNGFVPVADDHAGATTIEFSFTNDFLFEGFDYFDVEAGNESPFTVNLFSDASLTTLITSLVLTDNIGNNGYGRVAFDPLNVRGIEFVLRGSGGIDNLQYPVPIPAALPMFLFGLAGLGIMARRRKASAA